VEQAASSGPREGRALAGCYVATELRKSRSIIYNAAPALPRASPSQSERSRYLASLAPPEKRAAGAGVSPERTSKPAAVIGGAPEENDLLVLATS
jgi:hypothetical protein